MMECGGESQPRTWEKKGGGERKKKGSIWQNEEILGLNQNERTFWMYLTEHVREVKGDCRRSILPVNQVGQAGK